MTKCFLLERTGNERRFLRRYAHAKSCTGKYSYHNASTVIGDFEGESSTSSIVHQGAIHGIPLTDPRWPTRCECGYEFAQEDEWQVNNVHLWKRKDTGELYILRDAPPGAMWFADWYEDNPKYCGPDGRCLIVRCPDGHDWMVDRHAKNCTMPDDYVHRCWVRHGEAPMITVDKNGRTCAAGAGSIDTGKWHGFLRNGEFVLC